MMKKQLTLSNAHTVRKGDITRTFTFKVYEGLTDVYAEYQKEYGHVKVKAYCIEIYEEWADTKRVLFTRNHSFGYITSRSNEVAYLFTQFKKCDSLKEMADVVNKLKWEYRVTLQKDGQRKLREILEGPKSSFPVWRRTRQHTPLPQIKLPWDSEE